MSIGAPPPIPVYIQPATIIQPAVTFLGSGPQTVVCPSCQRQVVTLVRYEVGTATWLIALLIFLFGGFLGCCLIPFCMTSCQDAVHTCPLCHKYIGRKNVL